MNLRMLLVVSALGVAPAIAGTTFINYFNFDNAPLGTYQDGDTVSLPLWGGLASTRASVLGATDGLVVAAAPAGAPQGGNVLQCDSGGFEEGVFAELSAGLSSTEYGGDLTVEIMFRTTAQNLAGNTVGLQNLISGDWPTGPINALVLRILGDGAPVGRPGDSQKIEWVAGHPSGEVRVVATAQVIANNWYHVAGVVDFNESNPANSVLRLYIDDNPSDSNPPVEQGSGTLYNLSVPEYDYLFGAFGAGNTGFTVGSPAWRYAIGSSFSRIINGGDNRGLDGEIDAVAITNAALTPGNFLLPDGPPVTGVRGFELYR